MGTVNFGHVKGADGQGVPAGGGTGSFLRKLSAADWDTEWKDVLPVDSGGTGATSAADARAALGAQAALGAGNLLPVASGGTGAGNAADARTALGAQAALGAGNLLPVTSGGTGSGTAAGALSTLGAMPVAGGTFTGAVYAAAESLWLNSAGQYFNDSLMTTASGTALAMYSNGKVVKSSSSRRYKDEICYLDESTADDAGADCLTIYQLRPVTYEYKQQRGERQVGLIAEDVAQIDPSLCVRNEAGDVESVKYQDVGILVLRAVQLLQAQVLAMGDRIAALEGGGEA